MFKNVNIYRLDPDWSATIASIESALEAERFTPCSATQDRSIGWVEPRGHQHGALVESVGGQYVLKLMVEAKAVPGAVVRREAEGRMAHIEATTGRKPGRKEAREIREDARQALLPMAFAKQSAVLVWIDPVARLLVTDAASQARSDEVITALVRALPGLAPTWLRTAVTPQTAMARWLSAATPEDWPPRLSIERECELKSGDEARSVVKFVRHPLLNDEIRQHIARGLLPTRLALSWDGRVAFVLTESLQLRKIGFLEGVFDDKVDQEEDRFDADIAISTAELTRLIADLAEALGGELPQESGRATANLA